MKGTSTWIQIIKTNKSLFGAGEYKRSGQQQGANAVYFNDIYPALFMQIYRYHEA